MPPTGPTRKHGMRASDLKRKTLVRFLIGDRVGQKKLAHLLIHWCHYINEFQCLERVKFQTKMLSSTNLKMHVQLRTSVDFMNSKKFSCINNINQTTFIKSNSMNTVYMWVLKCFLNLFWNPSFLSEFWNAAHQHMWHIISLTFLHVTKKMYD